MNIKTQNRKRSLDYARDDVKKPLVSVIMPVYNAGEFLVDAVESILTQTYQNYEFIIVDDCSTDGSWELLQAYKSRFPKKITLVCTDKNLNRGGDACANLGMQKAQGTYIARMDADDISMNDRLEKQVAFLEKNPDITLVGSQAMVIDKYGKKIGVKKEPISHDAIYRAYFTYHPIIHPSVMIRRVIEGKPFSYKLGYSANNDYYSFFSLLCTNQKFANLEENLIKYRIHTKNDTFTNIKEKFRNTYQIRSMMVKTYGYSPSPLAWIIHYAQYVILRFLPESVIQKLYLSIKGIVKIKIHTPSFSPRSYYASFAKNVANLF